MFILEYQKNPWSRFRETAHFLLWKLKGRAFLFSQKSRKYRCSPINVYLCAQVRYSLQINMNALSHACACHMKIWSKSWRCGLLRALVNAAPAHFPSDCGNRRISGGGARAPFFCACFARYASGDEVCRRMGAGGRSGAEIRPD